MTLVVTYSNTTLCSWLNFASLPSKKTFWGTPLSSYLIDTTCTVKITATDSYGTSANVEIGVMVLNATLELIISAKLDYTLLSGVDFELTLPEPLISRSVNRFFMLSTLERLTWATYYPSNVSFLGKTPVVQSTKTYLIKMHALDANQSHGQMVVNLTIVPDYTVKYFSYVMGSYVIYR